MSDKLVPYDPAVSCDQLRDDILDARRHNVKRLVLDEYAKSGNLSIAAKAVGISRQTHYDWLKQDPEYELAFQDARDQYIDRLEAEADRRGVAGVDKPVFYQGNQVATVKEYSDVLLIFRLKALRPEMYRDNVDITSAGRALKIVINQSDARLQSEIVDAQVREIESNGTP